MNHSQVYKNSLILIILTCVLKLVGFINRTVTAYYYGINTNTDVYYSISGIVESFFAIILSGLTVGMMNLYFEKKDNDIAKGQFITNVIILYSIISIIMALFCILFSKYTIRILMPGFDDEQISIGSNIFIYLISMAPLQTIITILSSVMQAEKKFVIVRITGTLSSIVSIFCVILFSHAIGIDALVLAFVVGYVVNTFIMFFSVKNIVKIQKPSKIINNVDISKLNSLIFPIILGTAGHEVNLIIDKSVASKLKKGAISSLSYSTVFYLFIENIIINSFMTAIFPDLIEKVKNKHIQEAICQGRNIIFCMEFLLIPICIITYICSEDLVQVAYMHGKFNMDSVIITSYALSGYIIGLPMLAIKCVVTKFYYAYGDTKSPFIINLICVAINIFLDFILGLKIGVFGITVATTISNIISSVVMSIHVRKHQIKLFNTSFKKELFILILAGFNILLALYIVKAYCHGLKLLVLAIFISFFIEIIYLTMSHSKYFYSIKNFLIRLM